jgi:glycosyltransferase involved in cell wall biosynthesis
MGSTPDEPLSILLPVRDGAKWLGQAVTDLASGLRASDEFLVLEDGSSDATPQLLTDLCVQVPQLRVIHTGGVGLVEALNLGIRESSHPWIARADADDRYPADRLSAQRHARRGGIAAITGDYQIVGPDGSKTYMPCALGSPFVALSLLNPQRFPHPGVMYHRDAVLEAGGYRHEDYPAEDLGLWMRMAHVGELIGIPHVVVDWQMSAGSITHGAQGRQRELTQKLVSDYEVPKAGSISINDVKKEIDRYQGTAYEYERLLLLARDMWSARSNGVSTMLMRPILVKLGKYPQRSVSAARGLKSGVDVRRKSRHSIV